VIFSYFLVCHCLGCRYFFFPSKTVRLHLLCHVTSPPLATLLSSHGWLETSYLAYLLLGCWSPLRLEIDLGNLVFLVFLELEGKKFSKKFSRDFSDLHSNTMEIGFLESS